MAVVVVSWAWPSHFCTRLSGMPAETPKPWRSPLGEPGGPHDSVHGTPAGHARPRPKPHSASLAAARLPLEDTVHHVERTEQGRGTDTER